MNPGPHEFYYGSIIVGLGLISMSFWFGVRSSFSVFYVALLEEFHWSRGEPRPPSFMAAAADLFKGRIFGLVYGIVEGAVNFGGAIKAWAAGFIFDQTKSYRMAFVLVIAVCFLVGIFIWIAAPRKARKTETGNEER